MPSCAESAHDLTVCTACASDVQDKKSASGVQQHMCTLTRQKLGRWQGVCKDGSSRNGMQCTCDIKCSVPMGYPKP